MAVPRPLQFPGPRRRLPLNQQTLATAGLALVAIVLAALISHDFVFPPSQNTAANLRTATVTLGTVRSAVSATGTLVPAQQLNVGFKTPGTLTEVDVKVGDKVTAGQVLAKLDPTQLQLALDQANASLTSAQANLQNTENGTALVQAQHALDQARQNYNNAVNSQNADQNTLNADTNTLNADQGTYAYQQYLTTLQQYQSSLTQDQAKYQADGCLGSSPSPNCTTGTPSNPSDQQRLQTDQNNISCLQTGNAIAGGSCTFQQQQMASAYKTVQADQGRVNGDQAKVNADASQVQSAQNQVTNAQDSYNNQAANRPATIAQQQAAVASAQAAVNTAQNNINSAVLTAPSDGVVSAINGGPGDSVTAQSSSAIAQAPGSTAPLPSSSSGSGSGSSGSSGGSAFITLLNTTGYQAVVNFAESDAAKVKTGQAGTVTFDALPNLTIPVHVLALAPSSTTVSNVVNYYVTLTLDNLNSNLRAGLTTNAQIIVSQAANVLTVPNSAITRLGQNAFVTVLGANGVQTRTPVQVGVAGDSLTEITSGLQAGDKVVLPQLRASSANGGRGLGGGFGGGPVQVVGGGTKG